MEFRDGVPEVRGAILDLSLGIFLFFLMSVDIVLRGSDFFESVEEHLEWN